MEWHWYYLWIIVFVGVHVWAFTCAGEPNPEVEKMWEDNF